MGRMGSFSIDGLEELQEQLNKVREEEAEAFVERCARELAGRLLGLVIDRTPVGVVPKDIYDNKNTKVEIVGADGRKRRSPSNESLIYQKHWAGYTGGELRRSWTVGLLRKEGSIYKIEVINNTKYASYVEYGHRQQPGRFVPALGKQLKKGWVEGKHMLEYSVRDIQQMAPKILEARIKEFLKECME